MIQPDGNQPQYGQWLELVNRCDHAVNLLGWSLVTASHADEIQTELLIQPGQYLLLGASNDPDLNFNVQLQYVLASLHLPTKNGQLTLYRHDGTLADSVTWSDDNGTAPPLGYSIARIEPAFDAPWQFALREWPGSRGNFGSPGHSYAYQAIESTPTPTVTHTAVAPTQTPAATSTPVPGNIPLIRISEIMADPAVVPDETGEWFELFNADTAPVNLKGWALSDLDHDRHEITADVWIAPDGYLVLARNGQPQANGGVQMHYVYDSLTLANESDELCLYTPWGSLADQFVWGESSPYRISAGASLERVDPHADSAWAQAHSQWPGSYGDYGSPGAPYTPAATPTSVPTLAAEWPISNAYSPLVIEEVLADGQEEEFVVLLNRTDAPVDLTGWAVGDAETPGDGEGVYALPEGYVLQPGQLFIIARNALVFTNRWGFPPQAEFESSGDAVHTLARLSGMASGTFALNDSGDEVILWNPSMTVADALAYGDAELWRLGLHGRLPALSGQSYQHDSSVQWNRTDDQRYRIVYGTPSPGAILALPAPNPQDHPTLSDGFVAVWGSMGSHSNFTRGESRSPHYLAADAASEGYDFLAIADDGVAHTEETVQPASALVLLPAWQWPSDATAQAIVYSSQHVDLTNWDQLRSWLETNHVYAQSRNEEPPAIAQLAACSADEISAHDFSALVRAWRSNGRSMLPAGNASPGRDGYAGQLYTGLAVRSADQASVMEAIANRRGWASSSLDAWLTVRTDSGAWMGATIDHCGETTVHVQYGDRNQQAAGLTLWRNDEPVQQLDAASSGQTWSATVDTEPGDFIYASAAQFDGDYAVTAPILVSYTATGCEVTPGSAVPPPSVADLDDDDDERVRDAIAVFVEQGQQDGQPGTLARAKLLGLHQNVEFRAQVVAPPGLYNSAIYVAEPAASDSAVAGMGMQVYLGSGDFAKLAEGDWVLVKGELHSYRGEMEVLAEEPHQVWRIGDGTPVQPLPISASEVGESLEGRLVTFSGQVTGWRGDSFYVCDPNVPEVEVQITVRSSLDWKRPYVNVGETWNITGIVSQFAKAHPWNDGYRVLARFESDLVNLTDPQ